LVVTLHEPKLLSSSFLILIIVDGKK
jgi:hypothetical protein